MVKEIGKMLCQLRKSKQITQSELGRGISNVQELSRIECGVQLTDKMLLDALFQRMGKSTDKLEIVLSHEEYTALLLQEYIKKNFLEKRYDENRQMLDEYESYRFSTKSLQRQYLLKMRALNEYLVDRDCGRCLNKIEEALEVTFSGWKEKWDESYLSSQELQLIMIIGYLTAEAGAGDVEGAIELGERIIEYVDSHYTDGEEKSKVYPHCVWFLGSQYIKIDAWEKAYNICQKGMDCLVENGVLTLMRKIMDIQMLCSGHMDKTDEQVILRNQKNALDFVYQTYGTSEPEEEILYILLSSHQGEYMISNEILRDLRIGMNISQEKLSENICTQETLSRIESGKRTPNRRNFMKLMEKMGVEQDFYSGFILSDDYEIYEDVRRYNRLMFAGDMAEAEKILNGIESRIDMKIAQNKQYIEMSRLQIQIRNGKVTGKVVTNMLTHILRYTMKDYTGDIYTVPSREEYVILNQMGISYKNIGEYEKAIAIYEQVLDRYQKSKVEEVHHAITMIMLYINYEAVLEENNDLEKAEIIGRKGIELCIKCNRGDAIGKILANLACIYEKEDTPEHASLCNTYLKNSYFLCKIFLLNNAAKVMWDYYKKKYGVEL